MSFSQYVSVFVDEHYPFCWVMIVFCVLVLTSSPSQLLVTIGPNVNRIFSRVRLV